MKNFRWSMHIMHGADIEYSDKSNAVWSRFLRFGSSLQLCSEVSRFSSDPTGAGLIKINWNEKVVQLNVLLLTYYAARDNQQMSSLLINFSSTHSMT